MTDRAKHRLSLLLALFGAMVIIAHVSNQFRIARLSGNLPTFQKATPQLQDWPRFHTPVGREG